MGRFQRSSASECGRLILPNGHFISYQCYNPGSTLPLIILSNGSLFHYSQWDIFLGKGLIPRLANKFRIVRYDYSGTGRSFTGKVQWSIESLSQQLEALLDHFHCAQANLYGLSKGTIVNQYFAATHPNRVLSLAGYGWFHFQYSRMDQVCKFFSERLQHFKFLETLEATELNRAQFDKLWNTVYELVLTSHRTKSANRFAHMIVQFIIKRRAFSLLRPTPARNMYEWFAYAVKMLPLANQTWAPLLHQLMQVPTLIQHARHDNTLPFKMAEELHHCLPSSKLLPYGRGFNHVSILLDKAQASSVAQDYVDFLDSLEGG